MPLAYIKEKNSCYPKGCNTTDINTTTDVLSVNGKTGHVRIDAIDVNAIPDPKDKRDGGYLKYQNGNYVLADVIAQSEADFNGVTHVVTL